MALGGGRKYFDQQIRRTLVAVIVQLIRVADHRNVRLRHQIPITFRRRRQIPRPGASLRHSRQAGNFLGQLVVVPQSGIWRKRDSQFPVQVDQGLLALIGSILTTTHIPCPAAGDIDRLAGLTAEIRNLIGAAPQGRS